MRNRFKLDAQLADGGVAAQALTLLLLCHEPLTLSHLHEHPSGPVFSRGHVIYLAMRTASPYLDCRDSRNIGLRVLFASNCIASQCGVCLSAAASECPLVRRKPVIIRLATWPTHAQSSVCVTLVTSCVGGSGEHVSVSKHTATHANKFI